MSRVHFCFYFIAISLPSYVIRRVRAQFQGEWSHTLIIHFVLFTSP